MYLHMHKRAYTSNKEYHKKRLKTLQGQNVQKNLLKSDSEAVANVVIEEVCDSHQVGG